MKHRSIFLALFLCSTLAFSQNVIFLHHSTGGNVYNIGDVPGYIDTYNSDNGASIQVTERAYPNNPYPWNNYPYDYWNLWVNGACDNQSAGIECLESIASSYDIIIWKHCFPGAGIAEDNGEGDITSSVKTLPNYKLQYRALRTVMDELPDNEFIVWTLAPLHRLSTSQSSAARAGEFVEWVKNDWLTEDGKEHPNIHVFDFFGIVAEQSETPDHGFQYCLKYEYEGSHESGDSHPNTLANETAGPLFAEYIIDVATGNTSSSYGRVTEHMNGVVVFPNPTYGLLHFDESLANDSKLTLFSITGKKILEQDPGQRSMDISHLKKGIYFLKTKEAVYKVIKK
jgi:hypothetical protein